MNYEDGWQDGLEVCTLTSKLSSLGSNLSPAKNCPVGLSQAGCVPLLNERPICQHYLVDINDPTVSFMKNR